MKRTFISMFTIFLLAACSKNVDKPALSAEEPITKTIEFNFTAATDYSKTSYDSTTAEVKLSVYKSLYEPYREQVLWDTLITRKQLKEYMKLPTPLIVSKTFRIVESKEKIGAGYSISYVTPPFNTPTWSAFGGFAEFGKAVFKVTVNI
jgi:hypothetical protein